MMQTHQSMDWQGHLLGRYRMQRLLGRGGMGEVWLAEDPQLRRQVAIKLLPPVLASDSSYLHAFAYEARVAAALEHPHILPVHDFGEHALPTGEVVTYLVMPNITGGSLRERMRGTNRPAPGESMLYLRQAAQAIDYAHSQGVLHRDIKPANMLLQQEWLLLADFGLAKLLTSVTYRSQTHTGAGTPEYMAPEQARGQAEAASDRYSLAITAYQLFTSTLPFRGDTPYNILIKQIQEAPPSPRQFNPALPQAVENILLQGLAKRPVDRPASCIAFVDALEQVWQRPQFAQADPEATVLAPWNKRRLAQEPTVQPLPPQYAPAMPPSYPQMPPAFKQAQLSQQLTQGTSSQQVTGPAAFMPNTGPALYGHDPSTMPTARAQDPTSVAAADDKLAPQQHKVSRRALLIGGSAAVVAAAGGTSAYILLRSKPPVQPVAKPIPGPKKLIAGIPVVSLTGHSKPVWNAVWDRSGRYLATCGDDDTVMVWDIASSLQKKSSSVVAASQPFRSWRFSGNFESNSLSWSPDGRALLVTDLGTNHGVSLVDVFGSTKQPVAYLDIAQASQSFYDALYSHAAWSPVSNNTFATVISESQQVALWPFQGFKESAVTLRTLTNEKGPKTISGIPINIQNMAWSADGSLLGGLTNNANITAWDIKTGVEKYYINTPDDPGIPPKQTSAYSLRSALQWSPVNSHVVVATNITIAGVWDLQKNKQLAQLGTDDRLANTPPPKNNTGFTWNPNVTGLAFAPNGRYIAGGYGRSHHIYVWDLQAKTPRLSKKNVQMPDLLFGDVNGHGDTIIDMAWSPDGRYLATTSFDTTVIVWKVDGA